MAGSKELAGDIVGDFLGTYVPSYIYEASIGPDAKDPNLTRFSVRQQILPIEDSATAETSQAVLSKINGWRFLESLSCSLGLLLASGVMIDGATRFTHALSNTEDKSLAIVATVEIIAALSLGVERFRSFRRKENRYVYLQNFIRDQVWQAARPVLHHSPQQGNPKV